MTDSARGSLGPIYLDGHLLDKVVINDTDYLPRKLRETAVNVRGSAREALAFQGAGYPMLGVKHSLVIRFSNLERQYDLLDELMAAPGPHEVVVWKRSRCVYAGDGDRATFLLPAYVRDHFDAELGVPGELQAAEAAGVLDVEVRIGIDGAPMTVLVKNSTDYAAGSPASSEAWFLEGGLEFKVGTVPLAGQRLYLRYVPILSMIEEGQTPARRYGPGQSREPLDLALVEV